MKKQESISKSFLVAFLYVGLGTISILSLSSGFPLYGPWAFWDFIFTFPVSVFSFGFAYEDSNATQSILLIQGIVFLISWYSLYRRFINDGNNSNK